MPLLETARKVDLRERFLEIPRQTAISKDNTAIDIDFLVYYRIVNPKLSVLEVENVVQASLGIAATTLRAVIGDIELDDVLAKREQINDVLRVKLDEVTERWGLKVTRVEIREVDPPKLVQDAMNRQMSAERERRATVTKAEGERSAAIMVAEGEKQSAILRAEGEKESLVRRAEGEQQAQLLLAQGRASALEALFAEAKNIDEKTMMLQYLDALHSRRREFLDQVRPADGTHLADEPLHVRDAERGRWRPQLDQGQQRTVAQRITRLSQRQHNTGKPQVC